MEDGGGGEVEEFRILGMGDNWSALFPDGQWVSEIAPPLNSGAPVVTGVNGWIGAKVLVKCGDG